MTSTVPPDPVLFTQPPWKLVPGIFNFRDLGGYPIKGSTDSVFPPLLSRSYPCSHHGSTLIHCVQVKRNFIYRSAEPSRVTEDGMAILVSKLNVTATYDLRSKPELKSLEATCPVIDIPGITRHFVPVFEDQDLSPEQVSHSCLPPPSLSLYTNPMQSPR